MPITTTQHEQIREGLARREDELITLHRALVAIPSVNRGDGTSANETAVAELAYEYLSSLGIAVSIHSAQPGRGNLLAEIGGRLTLSPTGTAPSAPARKMLWMSHSDVVPAGDETAWSHPPFSAALVNGRIYGRGSNDCKMLVAAQLFALACLARMELPQRGTLRLAVGADEEVGGALGFGWLATEKKDFLTCDIAICEGGGATLGRFGGRPVIGVSSGEKGRYDVIFRLTSDGGHACAPWKNLNPVMVLNELLARIAEWQPKLQTDSPLFGYLPEWFGLKAAITPENIEQHITAIERTLPGMATSLRGQSRMTLTPTVIHGGDKANQIPTEMLLTCDARLLPGHTQEQLHALATSLIRGLPRVTFEIQSTSGPSVSPWTPELATMFERATELALTPQYAAVAGGGAGNDGGGSAATAENASAGNAGGAPTVQVAPTWCIGATDARYVRAVGTPVYGYQLIHPAADAGKLDIHCIDESIESAMLLPCALSLAHLAVDYLSE